MSSNGDEAGSPGMLYDHSRSGGWLRVVLFSLVIVIGLAGLVLLPAAWPDTVTPKPSSPVGVLVAADPGH